MCEEITKERKKGTKAAVMLARHLYEMGAENCQIPVTVQGVSYICEARITRGKYHLVEIPGETFRWHAVYGDPMTGKTGIGFKTADLAKEYIEAANDRKLILTWIPFHVEECCGCTDVYFSWLKQKLIAVCNECGLRRNIDGLTS